MVGSDHEDGASDDGLRDTVEFEADEEMGELSGAQAKIKKLREQLKEAQQKRDEYLAGWQREKADAINHRKEALMEADRHALRVKEGILEEVLPVLDSFDMAMGSDAWLDVSDNWRKGMEHVRNQLLEVLASNGIERFGKIDEQFNPRMHQVVQEVDDVAGEQHEIIKILRFGYTMGEHVLRPAQVFVKK